MEFVVGAMEIEPMDGFVAGEARVGIVTEEDGAAGTVPSEPP